MSQNTIAPIKYVPYIILYIQGKPFMRYNGPHDGGEIRRFVIEVANKVQGKQKFTKETVKDDGKGIPEFTTGHPLCGDDKRCYLEFKEAYTE